MVSNGILTGRRSGGRVRAASLSALLTVAIALGGCGEDADDNAVEAREGNQVELGGVRYRVVSLREINPFTTPDDALWTGAPAAAGTGLYMVALHACGAADGPARATGEIHLEDAFGQRFDPRGGPTADAYEYRPRTLAPGECLPRRDSPAEATFGGAVLVFAVPFEATAERPLVLELGDPASDATARVQLDL
jgi:hypothetical protein